MAKRESRRQRKLSELAQAAQLENLATAPQREEEQALLGLAVQLLQMQQQGQLQQQQLEARSTTDAADLASQDQFRQGQLGLDRERLGLAKEESVAERAARERAQAMQDWSLTDASKARWFGEQNQADAQKAAMANDAQRTMLGGLGVLQDFYAPVTNMTGQLPPVVNEMLAQALPGYATANENVQAQAMAKQQAAAKSLLQSGLSRDAMSAQAIQQGIAPEVWNQFAPPVPTVAKPMSLIDLFFTPGGKSRAGDDRLPSNLMPSR